MLNDSDDCAKCHCWKHYPRSCLGFWTSSLACLWWTRSRKKRLCCSFRSDRTQRRRTSCLPASAATAAWSHRYHRPCRVRSPPDRLVSCEAGPQFDPAARRKGVQLSAMWLTAGFLTWGQLLPFHLVQCFVDIPSKICSVIFFNDKLLLLLLKHISWQFHEAALLIIVSVFSSTVCYE